MQAVRLQTPPAVAVAVSRLIRCAREKKATLGFSTRWTDATAPASLSTSQVWSSLLPHPEVHVRRVRLPLGPQEELYVSRSQRLPPAQKPRMQRLPAARREMQKSRRLTLPPSAALTDNWSTKAIGRRTTGTGRMRYLKTLPRRFKNGFREGAYSRATVPRGRAFPERSSLA